MRKELCHYHAQKQTENKLINLKRNLPFMFTLPYRYKQRCYKYCPENTYRDESSLQCRQCPSNCDSCDKDKCNVCKEGFYLSGKQSNKYGIYLEVSQIFPFQSGFKFSNSQLSYGKQERLEGFNTSQNQVLCFNTRCHLFQKLQIFDTNYPLAWEGIFFLYCFVLMHYHTFSQIKKKKKMI